MNSYDVGDWVRYKGVACRVVGHWHDKDWTEYLILGVHDGTESYQGKSRVTRWCACGKVLPEQVVLIKRRPKEHAEVTEG